MGIRRLNHAVLYVRDVDRSVGFYTGVLDFRIVQRRAAAAFLRAAQSENDHDLGLYQVRGPATRTTGAGLCHLAWSVSTLAELAGFERHLTKARALVGASDHAVSKSLYGKDPDGLEFEITWFVPRDRVTEEMATNPTISRLNIDAEIARWGENLVGAP